MSLISFVPSWLAWMLWLPWAMPSPLCSIPGCLSTTDCGTPSVFAGGFGAFSKSSRSHVAELFTTFVRCHDIEALHLQSASFASRLNSLEKQQDLILWCDLLISAAPEMWTCYFFILLADWWKRCFWLVFICFYCVLHGRLAVQCICFLSHCIASSKHPGGVGAIAWDNLRGGSGACSSAGNIIVMKP